MRWKSISLLWLLSLVVSAVTAVRITIASSTSFFSQVSNPNNGIRTNHAKHSLTFLSAQRRQCDQTLELLCDIRGGSDEKSEDVQEEVDDDEEEDDDNEEEEEEEDNDEQEENEEAESAVSMVMEKVVNLSKRVAVLLGKASVVVANAVQRAFEAALEGDDGEVEDEAEPLTLTAKIFKTIRRMITAALTVPETEAENQASDDEVVKEVSKMSKKLKKTTKLSSNDDSGEKKEVDFTTKTATEELSGASSSSDFGFYLANQYAADDGRDENGPIFLGGSLSDALKEARSQARLLVVFIPSGKPSKKAGVTADRDAVQSLLSLEVAQAANKQARKNGDTTGSFLFWGAKCGSSEAATAIKRLKAKATGQKGEKRPVLVVVYPAQVSFVSPSSHSIEYVARMISFGR